MYVAGKVNKVPHAEEAFGFAFEELVLYAWSLGIGTTWIGGTMKRELFEKACGLREDQFMPCVSPLGYPAEKISLRESMMRKAIKADSRMPFETLFFDGLKIIRMQDDERTSAFSFDATAHAAQETKAAAKRLNALFSKWLYRPADMQKDVLNPFLPIGKDD